MFEAVVARVLLEEESGSGTTMKVPAAKESATATVAPEPGIAYPFTWEQVLAVLEMDRFRHEGAPLPGAAP